MICLPYLHAITSQKHWDWGPNSMLLMKKSNAVEDWWLTVISNILYDNEIWKRSKFAFFRSVLPLVANMRVFRWLVKIFRCLSVAARFHDVSCGHVFHPVLFVTVTIVTARQGRLLLPVTSSHRMSWRAFLCRSGCLSVSSVGVGADAAVSARTILYPSKSEWGSA